MNIVVTAHRLRPALAPVFPFEGAVAAYRYDESAGPCDLRSFAQPARVLTELSRAVSPALASVKNMLVLGFVNRSLSIPA